MRHPIKQLPQNLKPMKKLTLLSFSLTLTLFSSLNWSSDFPVGTKEVSLLDKKGTRTTIGSVTFTEEGALSRYQLKLDHKPFVDYFLSMKEMKCLEGPELWCHIPYPYKQPHQVSANKLAWLEHDLLFMYKRKSEFGANFWNGVYYHLELKEGVITGKAQAIDLKLLASPPDDLSIPPIGEAERDEIDWDKRWLPIIEIR